MIDGPDIFRATKLPIDQHGEDAATGRFDPVSES